jgi:N-sulfoglucosamine sulfohydrolase
MKPGNNIAGLISSLLVSLLLMFVFSCSKDAGPPPNIVFIFADDWGRFASVYHELEGGNTINSVVKTPNFDMISKEGVLFTNAHVNAPSCTPCRSSLLSGQYFYRTGEGAFLFYGKWDPDIPTYPLILEENGYHIGYTYKVWSPGTPRDAPYGGERTRYQPAGTKFNGFSQNVFRHISEEEGTIEEGKQLLYDEIMANFDAFLADREPGQPFCYWFGPTNTHRQWIQGSGKEYWGINPDDLEGKMPKAWPDIPEIREDAADYLGEVHAVDASIGLFVDRLREMGELENTLLVISGDHGIPGFPRAKTNIYEIGTAVSLAVIWPDKIRGDRVVHDFVNLMDLAPTFLEAAGLKPPDVMTGKSLIPVLKSKKEGWVDMTRDFVVTGRERHVVARDDGSPYPMRSVRTKDFRYIRNFRPERWPIGPFEKNLPDLDGGPTKRWFLENHDNPDYEYFWELGFGKRPLEELYDVNADPHELNNLAASAEYLEVKNELSSLLDSVLIATEDPRMEEDCVFEHLPYTFVREADLNRKY